MNPDMHANVAKLNPETPFPDVFPVNFTTLYTERDYLEFRNLDHFRFVVSKLTQEDDTICNITYADALAKLMAGVSDFPEEEQASIRNLVRENLHKRGLITEEVYESYRYAEEGTQVGIDVAKYAAGEADCVITPTRQYIDFFYELYVSVSYPYYISNADVRKHTAKLLATVEELERKHVFIKIHLVCPINSVLKTGRGNFFCSIPLFSHKEPKTVATMSSVVNDRLLRKFIFALMEDYYGDNLNGHKGYAETDIKGAMNIGTEFDEIKFFETVMEAVGHDGD